MKKTQDSKLQIAMALERERERVGFSAKVERERAEFLTKESRVFGQGLEREKVGFSAMNLERESWDFCHRFRERESSPSMETTFTLRERLRFSPRERELGY